MRLRHLLILAILCLLAAGPATAAGAHVTIQPGETLSGIAARYGTSASALAAANAIPDADLVVAGRRLWVPSSAARMSGASSGTYIVRAGDSLGEIAARYGTTVSALARTNGIANPNVVVTGTRLTVSGSARVPVSGLQGTPTSSGGHVVQHGESLGQIAARYGTSVASLARANGIADPNMVVAGTRLRVTGSGRSGATPRTAATSGWGAEPSRSQVAAIIARHAGRHGVDLSLARAVAWQESGWWQGARSSTGAIGVMQLMPGTASWVGPSLLGRRIDPYEVSDNIEGGVAFLAYLQRQTGDRRTAIASYYQGLGSVRSRGLFDDTVAYVSAVSSFVGRV